MARATRAAARRGAALTAIGSLALAVAAALPLRAAVAAFPGKDGRIAYVEVQPGGGTDIFTILPEGSGVQQLAEAGSEPSWSADGRELVFSRLGQGGTSQLFTVSAEGGDPTLVVDSGYVAPSPSFSPSGGRIIYTTFYAIRTIRADGTEPRTLLTAKRGGFGEAVFSPTGKRIAFAGQPEGKKRSGIWSMRRDGSRLRRLTSSPLDRDPDYSPDGRHILFARPDQAFGFGEIRVMRADGSRERRIPADGQGVSAAYAPDGDRIVLSIASGGPSSCGDLYTMLPRGSNKQRITHSCEAGDFGGAALPSWQPLPGQRLVNTP
jgi:Tol biopolymer transport system component